MRIELPEASPEIRPGRFFMLRRPEVPVPAIPRPFSVYRQFADGSLEFLIKVIGAGTRSLSEAREGSELIAVGPLGNGFDPFDAEGDPWVMLAGGIGSAPFYGGIEQALASGVPPEHLTMIYGAATESMLYDLDQFEALGARVLASTDDGSRGFHGNVLELLESEWEAGRIPERVRIATCGPEPMMNAVVNAADRRGLESWVSLETLMGCGVGICNGCAVRTRPDGACGDWPVRKCCVDGPVFPSAAIQL